MKMKLKKRPNMIPLIFFIITMIIFLAVFFLRNYSNKATDKIIEITKFNLDKYTSDIVLMKLNKDFINEDAQKELIKITKNKDDEIIALDYDLNKTYIVLNEFVERLNNNIQNFNEFKNFDSNFKTEKNSLIVSYPFGIYSDNIFVNNLGPRIPVKINLINNLSTNIKTKVTNYGINSLLLEMYIVVELKHEIVASKIYEVQSSYELLISSKILQGSIPNYFGGVIEKNSSMITS